MLPTKLSAKVKCEIFVFCFFKKQQHEVATFLMFFFTCVLFRPPYYSSFELASELQWPASKNLDTPGDDELES